jgi:glycosyltransferase involved in cell wall biosynthesis
MNNITYVFSGNRKNRFYEKDYEAAEFFYGLEIFNNQKYNLKIIEPKTQKFFGKQILKYLDTFFKKVINLPVYMFEYCSIENIKILLKTDKLVLVNESTFCSLAFLLMLLKPFKKIDVYVFSMGLYSKKLRFPKLEKVHYWFISMFTRPTKHIFFLGQGEMQKALNVHPIHKEKFVLFPFFIDTNFWEGVDIDIEDRKNILFVGNDGNRDPVMMINIIKHFKDIQFNVVSNLQEFSEIKLKNLKLFKGSFGSRDLTDTQLKKLYNNSKLVILPLKSSFQPSGQSVTLQAMSCGRAVIISETKGFWDRDSFKDKEHLFFVKNNDLDCWIQKIEELYYNPYSITNVEKKAKDLVVDSFSLKKFEKKLMILMELN